MRARVEGGQDGCWRRYRGTVIWRRMRGQLCNVGGACASLWLCCFRCEREREVDQGERDRRLEVGRPGIDYIQRPSWCCILTPPARLRPARIAAGDMRFREGTGGGWLEWCGAKRSMSRASIGLLGVLWACQPISLCHVDPSVLGSLLPCVLFGGWGGSIVLDSSV